MYKMVSVPDRLERLGLSDIYEVLDSSQYPLVTFRDIARNVKFRVSWKTFRKSCTVDGYTFSANTAEGKINLWQNKIEEVSPNRFKVLETSKKGKKLRLRLTDSLYSLTYAIGAYYLLGELRKDPEANFRKAPIRVQGMSVPDVAEATGYTRTYLYPLYHQHGKEFLNMLVSSKDKRTARETAIELKMSELLEGESVVYNKVLEGTTYRPDFFLPRCGLAIECDGLFWHSDRFLSRDYHRKKRDSYLGVGVRSLFFREDEINNKIGIVASILQNSLGKSSSRVFARKTKIAPNVDPRFFSNNHLMGMGQGRSYGLYFNGELVAAILVRWINKGQKSLDVSRFCTSPGTSVVGGFSKLVSAVVSAEKPKTIRTFIDLRYGQGTYLEKLGWEHRGESLSFQWTNGKESWHRMRYKGNSGYDQGLYKIWDCGQSKWLLTV